MENGLQNIIGKKIIGRNTILEGGSDKYDPALDLTLDTYNLNVSNYQWNRSNIL